MEYLPEPTILDAVRIWKENHVGEEAKAEWKEVKEIFDMEKSLVEGRNQRRKRAAELGIGLGIDNRKKVTLGEARRALRHVYQDSEDAEDFIKHNEKKIKKYSDDTPARVYLDPTFSTFKIVVKPTKAQKKILEEGKTKDWVAELTRGGGERHPNVLSKAAAAAGLTVKAYLAQKKREKEAEEE